MITLEQWREFADAVEAHIRDYTIPQYGDWPDDQMSTFSDDDIKTSIARYENRRGKGARGIAEEMRDCLKIAHYFQTLYTGHGPRVHRWQEFAILVEANIECGIYVDKYRRMLGACEHWHKLKQQVNQSTFGKSIIVKGVIQDTAVCNFDWSKWEQKPGKIYRMYPYRYQGRPTLPVARVKIKRAHPDAIMPEYKSEGAAGFDLAACQTVEIPPLQTRAVPLGWAFETPEGLEIQIRPRSGLSLKTPMLVMFGTVDSSYRGEVSAIVRNTSNSEIMVREGDRIAQGILAPVIRACFKECDDLSETVRGASGFGSTGV